MKPLGVYIHVPYCCRKCNYCNFYSLTRYDEAALEDYLQALVRQIGEKGRHLRDYEIDSIYFGGGTPSILMPGRVWRLIRLLKKTMHVREKAEITMEMNPAMGNEQLAEFREAGVNRLSIGMQSAVDSELAYLGRLHTHEDTRNSFRYARKAGFQNISLDLILGIPGQSEETLSRSLQAIASLAPEHVSAYMLKIEPDTPLYKKSRPVDEETYRTFYLTVCNALEAQRLFQYEISNFAKTGFSCRHNLKYWNCESYLGFGPAAHSFLENKRFHYKDSQEAFLRGEDVQFDGGGGTLEERMMLKLRLTCGIGKTEYQEFTASHKKEEFDYKINRLEKQGLLVKRADGCHLTREGFLVSNAVIVYLLDTEEIK